MQPRVLLCVVWICSRPYISTDSIVCKLWGDRRGTNCRKPNPINFPMQILDLLIFFADICSHTSRRLSRNPQRPCVTDISQSPGAFHIYFSPVATETLYSRGDGVLMWSLGMQILSLRLCDCKMQKTLSGARCHWSSQKWELSSESVWCSTRYVFCVIWENLRMHVELGWLLVLSHYSCTS